MPRNIIRGRSAAAIALSIEEALRSGVYQPDQPLPPIRRLAATLRVSPVTVAAAYRRLQTRGLLIAGGRRGTKVRAVVPAGPPAVDVPRARADLVDLATGNPD